ncbi:MAG: Ig-like domain-containing protein, partial [Balneolaceae bacterium]
MKKLLLSLSLLLIFSIIINSCKSQDDDSVVIQGSVTEQGANSPIIGATVQVSTPEEFSNIFNRSDSSGLYSLGDLDISEVTDLSITASAPNYIENIRNIKVAPGDNINGFDFSLQSESEENEDDEEEEEEGVSGPSSGAASIVFKSLSRETLHLAGSGGFENAIFTFEVQDSAGRSLSLDNAIDVEFLIVSGPNGGEGISPEKVRTNSQGLVTSNLFSGSVAGVVQIQARIERADIVIDELIVQGKKSGFSDEKEIETLEKLKGKNRGAISSSSQNKTTANPINNGSLENLVITSEPVSVTIHGGFPDANHFSFSSEISNFEGYSIDDLRIPLKVILDDEFSNPVVPGTAVYFSTTGGSIQGSGEGNTNEDGIVTVDLISGNPRPSDNITGSDGRPGYATVTAKTINKNNDQIEKTLSILFSTSRAAISATPTTMQLEPGESQEINYEITDTNGNPMARGTTVEIISEGGVELSGTTSRTLGNELFPGNGSTSFKFFARGTEELAGSVPITIEVTSPSGTQTTYEEIMVSDSENGGGVTGPPEAPAALELLSLSENTIN